MRRGRKNVYKCKDLCAGDKLCWACAVCLQLSVPAHKQWLGTAEGKVLTVQCLSGELVQAHYNLNPLI